MTRSKVSALPINDSTESCLAAFECHKEALLTNLRDAYEGGPKSEPFDSDESWHDLTDVAKVYFVLVTFKTSTEEADLRLKQLREFANILDQAHELAKYFFIDIEDDDFRKEWFAQTKTPEVFHDEVDEDDEELPDAMKEVVASLYTFATVARKVARKAAADMRRESGRPKGTSVLPPHCIINLANVYRRSTGRRPSRVEGPFARLVREFLTAIGQGGKLSNKYVVEKIKEVRAQTLNDANSPFRS